jgi:hypothetical protein
MNKELQLGGGEVWCNDISSPTDMSPKRKVSDVPSLEQLVPWTMRPLNDASLYRRVPWTTRPGQMCPNSNIYTS